MLEIVEKYKKLEDLGAFVPKSLLLIDRYKHILDKLDLTKKYNYDNYK